MLALNLKSVFKARGIEKPYSFLVKAGLPAHSATNLLNSKPRVFRLDHVELLCTVLVCDPNDLLIWIPEKGHAYTENFPLAKLKQDDKVDYLPETLASMPFKQLKEFTKTIIAKTNVET